MANARAEYKQTASASSALSTAAAAAAALRRRSNTVSPKHHVAKPSKLSTTDRTASDGEFCVSTSARQKLESGRAAAFGFTASTDYLAKNKRLTDVIRKMDASNERTKNSFAEIEKITAKCAQTAPTPPALSSVANDIAANKGKSSSISEDQPSRISFESQPHSSSGAIRKQPHADAADKSPVRKDRITFQDDNSSPHRTDVAAPPISMSFFKDRRRSAGNEETLNFNDATLSVLSYDNNQPPTQQHHLTKKSSLDQHYYSDASSATSHLTAPKAAPRRKSSEESSSSSSATNHIVSILKKKDHNESSSASSNASPVTFSSSVVDTPTRTSSSKQGILKKRSSFDESRYSRSHSPDERSILVRTPRRNSLEEMQHAGGGGILKQRSYEIKSDAGTTVTNEPHGILKKKETSTPSEAGYPKHVSISEAVILAAAELCKGAAAGSDGEFEIRPILKQDTPTISTPRPILKKKYSSETEEIRPILKSSRKSSREESSDVDTDSCRSILRTDSPAKRRSLCGSDPFDSNIVLERSRSYEVETYEHLHQQQVRNDGGAIALPPLAVAAATVAIEKPLISVQERIKNMERALSGDSPSPRVSLKRSRFKTQPVTIDEISW